MRIRNSATGLDTRKVGRWQRGRKAHSVNMTDYRAITLGGWMLSVLLVGFSSARADSTDLIETSYEVNVSGITVLDVKYRTNISATGYRSQASVKTRGVAKFFSDYLMEIESAGSFVNGQASPSRYTYRREKNDKIKAVELNWYDGELSKRNRPASKDLDTQAEIDTALSPNAADPLTAIFRIGTSAKASVCQKTQRIFDGREVFDLRFSFKREFAFDDSSPGAYRGAAYECRMTYVPVAGRYATKFRKRKEAPPTYAVWFAPVGTDVSGGLLLVPVRATGELDGLTFVAYASRVKIDGRPFNQLSLNKD
jgi:hypothetical protein